MTEVRAIDALVNSSFLDTKDESGLGYLFKDIGNRPAIRTPEDLLEQLDAAGIGAAVVSIMEPAHAEWVAAAHCVYPRKILPAMIVDPTKGMPEIRRVVEYHEVHGVRCLRIPPFRYTLLLWMGISGYLFFGEVPDAWALVGAALIALSGLYALHRESLRRRELAATALPPA